MTFKNTLLAVSLAPTTAGVRQPQNSRGEIVIRQHDITSLLIGSTVNGRGHVIRKGASPCFDWDHR